MIKNYIIQETLGKGAYGIVYKVQKKGTSDIYVIKQISLEGLTEKEKEEVKQEAFILSSIKSDFVVKYYDSFLEDDNINIVMEYCDGGDLSEFILEKKNIGVLLEEKIIWKLFLKITIGLADIHKMKILHRDLKTLNIFLKHGLEVKIGDLGVAKVLLKNSFAQTVIGTPYYLSPEICQEKPYNDKSDVWALGCILYELCTFKHPFEASHQGGLIMKILNNKPEPINSYYSKELSNLVFMLLDKNSKSRPSCVEILNNNMVINKVKEFGLYDYVKKINSSRNNSNKNKTRKTIDFHSINISNKIYSKQYSKDNIYNDKIIKFDIKNKLKHYSPIDLSNNSKNGNIKFKNIKHKKKSPEEIKINLIKIVNINNQKKSYIDNSIHNKNDNDSKYNNYFVNKTEADENNEKSLISKKYAKIYKQDRAELLNKKKSSQVQIIFKSPNESPKPNNIIEPKKRFILNYNKSNEIIIQNSKYENNKNDNKSNKYKYKFIKNENKHKNIVPIKIRKISDSHKEIDDDISIAKSDIFSNSIKKIIINKKGSTPEINRNKKINIVISNKKIIPSLNKISLLSRKDDSYSIEVGLYNNKKNENFSIVSSLEKNILNEENTIASSFQIFNNNLPKINKRNNNENKLITNECEYIDDDSIRKNKRCKSYLNPRINNDKKVIEHSNHRFKGEEKKIKYIIERNEKKEINPKNNLIKKSEKFNSYLPLVSKDFQLV